MEKLSYFGENSVQKGQNSVFQKNQKRKKRDKCSKIKPEEYIQQYKFNFSRWSILQQSVMLFGCWKIRFFFDFFSG